MSNDNLQSRETSFIFDDFESVNLKLQSWQLPSISMAGFEYPTRGADFNVPDTRILYNPVTLTFLVDADLKNYLEMFDWMKSFRNGNFLNLLKNGTLHIYHHDRLIQRVRFSHCTPSALGELSFSVSEDSVDMVCSITLEYSNFEFM